MAKKHRILLGSTVIICATAITFWVLAKDAQPNTPSESLWTLVDRMDWLRSLKEECVNNLNIVDSAKFLKGYTWYCDSWDNEIVELRNQINDLQKKDYEGLN